MARQKDAESLHAANPLLIVTRRGLAVRVVARKRCAACFVLKTHTAFHRRTAAPDGLDARCRECRRAYWQEWARRHRREYEVWVRKYREQNRERLRAYMRTYQRRRRALLKARLEG